MNDAPSIWAMVLGYNNAGDTIACIQSILKSTYPNLTVLYTDNGSKQEELDRVLSEVDGIRVIRIEKNDGPAKGFNAGIAYALREGAEYVVQVNNDTTFDAGAVTEMHRVALENPDAGVIVPKVYYYDHPRAIWSAGSHLRPFPPAIVMYKTKEDDDGRHDHRVELECATYCVVMFSRALLQEIGLMDASYAFFGEDYDHCLRAREAGHRIVFSPRAHVWHKISKTGGAGSNNPNFWRCYGKSEVIFGRKHANYGLATGRLHRLYVILRFLFEGHHYGLRPFLQGMREGKTADLLPIAAWDDASTPVTVIR